MRLLGIAVATVLGVLASAPSRAQNINVDFGDQAGVPPARWYGAAANQPGAWNVVNGNAEEPVPLLDTEGRETGVTLVLDLPFGQASFDNPAVTGGDAALMNDYLDLHDVPSVIEVRGLEPGGYLVYVYAWAPDDPTFITLLTIQEQDSFKIFGPWPGRQVERVTYGRSFVRLAAGEPLTIRTFGLRAGTLNGLQVHRFEPGVQPAPAPAAGARRITPAR